MEVCRSKPADHPGMTTCYTVCLLCHTSHELFILTYRYLIVLLCLMVCLLLGFTKIYCIGRIKLYEMNDSITLQLCHSLEAVANPIVGLSDLQHVRESTAFLLRILPPAKFSDHYLLMHPLQYLLCFVLGRELSELWHLLGCPCKYQCS